MNKFKFAGLNLLRNQRRALLSVSIIAIAVLALMTSGGYGLYTYHSLEESTSRDIGHIMVTQPQYFEQEPDLPLGNGLTQYEQIRQLWLADSRVKAVQPRIELSGLISNGENSSIFMGLGVLPNEFSLKGPFLTLEQGHSLPLQSSPDVSPIMLGKDLARSLKLNIGDLVTLLSTTTEGALNALDFQVQGIYSTGIPELDKRQIYISLADAQSLLVTDKVSTLSVFAFETESTSQLISEFQPAMNGLELTPWWQRAFFYQGVKSLYNRIFGVLGVVMAVVVFVALFNTLTMSVTERTREIGTLAALGASSGELILNFILEALWLVIVGVLVGLALSGLLTLGVLWADIQMPPPPGRNQGYPLVIYFSFSLAALVSFCIAVVCVLSSWLAARQGVKKPITEALIYV
ncbi:putative ABC transport system permease protein [Oceanospirillum multiglobuliferum]|uniref:ABC transporter permease n=1 Tax=Oceanospirillum multiglobuliferum TaxID=64969 RepID=A0A1T4N2W6_9GAMM|nr:FtsX-like permease family protein [Oceanospirillum multiglobuliferum]OPX55817.1 ABC transporter permease [Oceanospirillum multiglobuliferum]SJZ73613.1 putative ABC transport system permease protein [Oceanospirillum multiglobuliferum]